jgi:hypothetical protein
MDMLYLQKKINLAKKEGVKKSAKSNELEQEQQLPERRGCLSKLFDFSKAIVGTVEVPP